MLKLQHGVVAEKTTLLVDYLEQNVNKYLVLADVCIYRAAQLNQVFTGLVPPISILRGASD